MALGIGSTAATGLTSAGVIRGSAPVRNIQSTYAAPVTQTYTYLARATSGGAWRTWTTTSADPTGAQAGVAVDAGSIMRVK